MRGSGLSLSQGIGDEGLTVEVVGGVEGFVAGFFPGGDGGIEFAGGNLFGGGVDEAELAGGEVGLPSSPAVRMGGPKVRQRMGRCS